MEEDWYLVNESVWRKIGIWLMRECMEEDWYLVTESIWRKIGIWLLRVYGGRLVFGY